MAVARIQGEGIDSGGNNRAWPQALEGRVENLLVKRRCTTSPMTEPGGF